MMTPFEIAKEVANYAGYDKDRQREASELYNLKKDPALRNTLKTPEVYKALLSNHPKAEKFFNVVYKIYERCLKLK